MATHSQHIAQANKSPEIRAIFDVYLYQAIFIYLLIYFKWKNLTQPVKRYEFRVMLFLTHSLPQHKPQIKTSGLWNEIGLP